ncbi:hypothetical protein OOU_Y34scaffold00204g2 [Pyricularia oryzae Y34]|uniref:Uncharacterized protein n=2 Tax=Pyricularia oryzae TaxID=318829 RepID=A0AA97P5V6_PYRO3|nr:hypothetical protein OOU_Y34scaffold00204g2 [Pyricularia oryzae Y34]
MPKVGGQKGCDESELPPLGLRSPPVRHREDPVAVAAAP